MLNYKILIWLPQICPLWCCVSEQQISCDGFTRSFQLFLSQGAYKYLCYTSSRKLMIFLRRDHQSNWTFRYALFSALFVWQCWWQLRGYPQIPESRIKCKVPMNEPESERDNNQRTKVYSNNRKTFFPDPQCIANEIKISRWSNVSTSQPVILLKTKATIHIITLAHGVENFLTNKWTLVTVLMLWFYANHDNYRSDMIWLLKFVAFQIQNG